MKLMSRRAFVGTAVSLLIGGLALAHTPYRQWVVYRKRHLLIATDRATEGSYELGKALAGTLREHIPESHARAARAPDNRRIASLLATAQFDVALLPQSEAIALIRGEGPFANYAQVELRTLYRQGRFLLVSRADFPSEHAYLVTETLVETLGVDAERLLDSGVPIHSGSAEYLEHF